MGQSQPPEQEGPPPRHPDEGPEPTEPVTMVPFAAQGVTPGNESGAAMMAARERAALEARTFLALRNPRSFEKSRSVLLSACERFRFADSAIYAKPIGKKFDKELQKWVENFATGLSIRFAEEFARAWQNLDVSVVIIGDDDDYRTIEAVAMDYETVLTFRTQSRVPKFVERSKVRDGDQVISQRTNSRGQITYRIRAHDDALFTATQAAAAKAKREVVLMHCPSDVKEECEEAAERTVRQLGQKDPAAFIASIVATFEKLNVSRDQLEAYIGKSLTKISMSEARQLGKIVQAMKQGETTWDELVRIKAETVDATPGTPVTPTGKGTAGLKQDLAKKGEAGNVDAASETTEEGTAPAVPAEPIADKGSVAQMELTQPDPEAEAKRAVRAQELEDDAREEWKALNAKKATGEKLSKDELAALARIRRAYPQFMTEGE